VLLKLRLAGTAKIKIEAHKNERRKLKLTSLVRAVHALIKCMRISLADEPF